MAISLKSQPDWKHRASKFSKFGPPKKTLLKNLNISTPYNIFTAAWEQQYESMFTTMLTKYPSIPSATFSNDLPIKNNMSQPFKNEQQAVSYLESRQLDVSPDQEILLPKYQEQSAQVHDAINYLIDEFDYEIIYV